MFLKGHYDFYVEIEKEWAWKERGYIESLVIRFFIYSEGKMTGHPSRMDVQCEWTGGIRSDFKVFSLSNQVREGARRAGFGTKTSIPLSLC